MAEVNQKVILKTQELLGKHVKKPPLTDKLLKKPPFRFLHDLVKAVNAETGFFEGLYTPEELNSDLIKDKDAKTAFLQKAISVLSIATGDSVAAKPSKIVAGHEVDKTNEFLQALGKALTDKVNTADAVSRVLAGEKPSADKKKGKDKPAPVKPGPAAKPPLAAAKAKPEDPKKRPAAGAASKTKENKGAADKGSVPAGADKKKPKPKGKDAVQRSPLKDTVEVNGAAQLEEESAPAPVIEEPPDAIEPASELNSAAPSRPLTAVRGFDPISDDVDGEPEAGANESQFSLNSATPFPQGDDGQMGFSFDEKPNEDDMAFKIEETSKDGIEMDDNFGKDSRSGDMEGNFGTTTPGPSTFEEDPLGPDAAPTPRPDTAATSRGPLKSALGMRPPSQKTPTFDDEPARDARSGMKSAVGSRPVSRINTAVSRAASGRPRTGRPASARPAPPRVRQKTDFVDDESLHQPQAGRVANVLFDTGRDDGDDDEDANFVVQETGREPGNDLTSLLDKGDGSNVAEEIGGEHGALVSQILATKSEFEQQTQPDGQKIEIEKVEGAESTGFGAREREAMLRDVANTQKAVQGITRVANPLAHLMEYLQEDVEAMNRELEQWTKEKNQCNQLLKIQQREMEQGTEPLKIVLQELETSIIDQLDKISAVKSTILKNEERIQRLLLSTGFSAKS